MATQPIVNLRRGEGLAKNENPNQGAFIIDELTELVEEAVFAEFEMIAEHGGVLDSLQKAVRCCSLGQITNALFEVGGQYRRSM